MKIAQLIIRFHPAVGGAETHCLEISKRLVKDGHEVTVYTSDLESEYPWKKLSKTENEYKGIKIKHFNAKRGVFYQQLNGLKQELEKDKPDIIHAHAMPKSYTDIAAKYCKKTKTPLIISTIGLHFHENPRKLNLTEKIINKTLIWGYYLLLGKKALKQADKIHVFSNHEKQWLMNKGIKPTKIKRIGSGINYKEYQKKRPHPEKNYLLFIGRIDKGKGLEYLIKALKGTNEKLIIIGKDFGYKTKLESLIKELKLKKQVNFKGYVSKEEKIATLQHCKALILPSKYESFGRVLLEAMACGKPVIASNTGGIPDFIPKKMLVKYGNIKELKEKIQTIKKPTKKWKQKAKEYDWNEIYKKTKKIYEEL